MEANGTITYYTTNSALDGRLDLSADGSLMVKSLRPDDEARYECMVETNTHDFCEEVVDLKVRCNGKKTKVQTFLEGSELRLWIN